MPLSTLRALIKKLILSIRHKFLKISCVDNCAGCLNLWYFDVSLVEVKKDCIYWQPFFIRLNENKIEVELRLENELL